MSDEPHKIPKTSAHELIDGTVTRRHFLERLRSSALVQLLFSP